MINWFSGLFRRSGRLAYGGAIALLFTVMATTHSCSKEEDIPFIDNDSTVITPSYYHVLEGRYEGTLSSFKHDGSDNEPVFVRSTNHTVTVSEIDFVNVIITDITDQEFLEVRAELTRVTGGAYFEMDSAELAPDFGRYPILDGFDFNGAYIQDSSEFVYQFTVDGQPDFNLQQFVGFRVN